MAVGDVVNDLSADNTALTFQPAAGVECVITSVGFDEVAGSSVRMIDGVTDSKFQPSSTDTEYIMDLGSMKIFINNTNHISIGALGADKASAFTGIQTK